MAKKQKLVVETGIGTFTRTTARTYTHIVVGHWDLDGARRAAYEFNGSPMTRKNFDYYQRQAYLGPEGLQREHLAQWKYERPFESFVEEHDRALAHIKGGYDEYVARIRRQRIESFHQSAADGGFNPFAFAWCGRLDLAQKQADTARKRGLLDVEIFPVPQG